ncbi:MAG: hypothetical protein M3Q45_09240, partial [Chloroflexota bacterium]|nr:hypothetical protein [Chloroflexota bacterium]
YSPLPTPSLVWPGERALLPAADQGVAWPSWLLITLALAAVVLGERFFAWQATPAYFRYGLPIFARRYPIHYALHFARRAQDATVGFAQLMGEETVEFYALDEQSCFFRQAFDMGRNGRSWLAHGLVQYTPVANQMIIKGYVDWSLVIIAAVLGVLLVIPIVILPFINLIVWQKIIALIGLGVIFFYLWRWRRQCDWIGRYFAE